MSPLLRFGTQLIGRIRVAAPVAVVGAVLLVTLVPRDATAKSTLRAIAVEGQTAPGTGGAFNPAVAEEQQQQVQRQGSFDEPMVNNSGDAAFIGGFGAGSDVGVFLSHEGKVTTVGKTGQQTSVGKLGGGGNSAFDGPAINNDRTVVFSARNMTGSVTSALFRKPRDGSLSVLARQGDNVPGGGKFVEFDDVALNNSGDVAFIASYDDGGPKAGVFLKPKDGGVRAIIRSGAELPNTGDGKLCDNSQTELPVDGPWLNDQRQVAFQVGCFVGGTPGLEGSVFLKKNNDPIRTLLKIGDHSPVGGDITAIHVGRPGINNTDAVFLLDTVSDPSKVIATKKLSGSDLEVCAKNGQGAPSPLLGDLALANGAPSIDEDGDIAIAAEAEQTVNQVTTDVEAIFTCRDGNVKTIAYQGGPKPVGSNNVFGSLEETSIAEDHVVFLDETNAPTGVFLSDND